MPADENVLHRIASALAASIPGGAAQTASVEPARLLVGKIVALHAGTPATVDVTTDGVNTRVAVPTLIHPAVNDVVWLLEQPPILLVIGASAAW